MAENCLEFLILLSLISLSYPLAQLGHNFWSSSSLLIWDVSLNSVADNRSHSGSWREGVIIWQWLPYWLTGSTKGVWAQGQVSWTRTQYPGGAEVLMPSSRVRKLLTETRSTVMSMASVHTLNLPPRLHGGDDLAEAVMWGQQKVPEATQRVLGESNRKEDLRNVCPAGEIAQWVNYLLYKYGDLSSK